MSVYPGAIPSSGDLPDAGANLSSNPHSSLHDDVRDEVIAIATELGVEPSGTAATVRARLDQGLGLREIVTFTADGTFTKASYPWLRAVRVKVQAGGGGGGRGGGGARGGSGGGGGGYAESFIPAADLGASESVTVGSGGAAGASPAAGTTSSFGSFVVTGGGGAGVSLVSPAGATTKVGGGDRGSVSAGDLQIPGQDGSDVRNPDGTFQANGGAGGDSALGSGGARREGADTGGYNGAGFGSGGSGGVGSGATATRDGGGGADGIVIVELYA